MINKYGNDWKNNIWWNKEYPFIPKVTNDNGFTIHEDDIVEFYRVSDKYYAARVCKIYDKNHIWIRYERSTIKQQIDVVISANNLCKYQGTAKKPKIEDLENQGIWNHFESFLGHVYADIYPTELNLPNDWHFDEVKFDAKRMEEVNKIKYGN